LTSLGRRGRLRVAVFPVSPFPPSPAAEALVGE